METNFIEMELEDLENTDLICPYCNRKVDILNENLQFSIDEHSQSPFHIRAYKLSQKNNTVQSDAQEQNQHKIDLIFKNILKKFKNDKTYLTVLNDNIFCNLCCFEITHEDNLNFKLIEEHLGGKMHATYLNVIGSNSNIICGENISDSELLYEMLSDGDVFSNLPHELSVNRYFIFMNHDGRYFCQLCEILIEVNNESVLKHIKSKVHLTIVDQKYDNGSVIFENSRKFKHLEDYDQLENTECASINEQQYTTLSQQDVQLGAVPISIINEHYGLVEQRHDKSSVENSIKFQPLEDYSQLDNTECLSINEITEQQYTLSQQDVQLASVPINEHYELVRSKRRSKRRNKNPIESSKTFQHLEDYGQLETNKIKKHQYSTLSQQDVQLAAVPKSTTVNKDYDDLVNQFEESLPKIFEKNKLFIVKFNTNYKCCLCNVKLIFNRNISKLISNFKQHLNTLRHKQAVRKYFGLKPIPIQVVQDGNETRSSNKLKPANSLVKSKAEKGFPSKESPKPIANNISFGCLNSKVDSFSHTGTNEKNKSNGAVPKLTMNYTVPFKFPQISKNSKIMSDYECLKKIFYPFLPREIEKNQKFIVKITDNEFCCILCRAKFCITSNVDSAIRMLCQHFKGKKHVENIELKNQNKLNDIGDSMKPQESLSSLISSVDTKCVSNSLTLQSDNNIKPNIGSTFEVKEPSTNICFLESDDNKSDGEGNSQFVTGMSSGSSDIPVMSDYDCLKSLKTHNLPKDIEENQDKNETTSYSEPKPANSLLKSKAEKVLLSKESSLPITHNISTDSLDSKVNSFSLTDTNDKYKLNSSSPKLTMNYSVPLKCSQISTKSKISSGYECLKKILHPYSPKEIKENHMFIVKITDNEFCCVLCKAKLFITKNVDSTISMFCQHFNGKRHVENIKNQIKLKDISDTVKPQETLSSLNSPVESKFVSDNLTLQSDNNINPNIASTFEVKEPSTNICFLESDDIKSEVQGNLQFTSEINASSFNIPVMSDYDSLKLLIYQDLPNEVEENIYRSRKLDSNLEKLEYENNVEKNDEHTFISEEPNSNLSTPQSFVSCISSEMSSVGAPVVSDFDVFKQLFILNVPKEVEENQSFIEKRSDKIFVCNLCEKKFYIFPDANYTLELFHLHFINKKHVRKVSSKQSEQKYAPDEMIEPKECSISTPLSLLHCTNPVMDPEANFGTAETMDGYKSTDISSPSSDVKTFSDFDCLLNLLAPSLPKEVEENQMFIVKINDKMFECTLCKVKGYISHHIKKTVEKFCKHFTSETHAVNVMAYNNCWQKCVTGDVKPIETLPESVSFVESERSQTQPTNDVSKNVIVQDNYLQSVIAKLSPSCSNDAVISDYQYLKQILSPYLPKDIEESQAFVKVTDKELQCMLCDKTFVILPKVEQTVHPFCLHLISDKHKKKHHIEKHRKNINNAFVDSGKIILKFLTLFIFYVDYDFDDSAIRLYDVNILSNIIYVEPLKYFLRNNSNFISDFVRSQKIIHPYLPQTLESNEFIVTKNGYFQCRLCKVNITGWFDSDNIEHKCCEHFTSSDHIINVLAVLATFNLEVMYQEVQLDSKNDHVKELFYPCKVPDIVEQNKNHLVESGKQFICSWCGCKIAISANICDRIINFCQHFNNAEHSGSATRYKDEMQLSVLNSLKLLLLSGSIPQIIEENLDYLVRIGEDYLCNVCNMKIKKAFTPSCTISNFVQHLSNLRHIQSVDALSKKNEKHQ